MNRFMRTTPLVALLFSLALPAFSMEVTGSAAIEARAYFDDPQQPRQRDGINLSVVLEPELYHVSENRKDTFTFSPFLRLDSHDAERTHADVRDLSWLHAERDWEIKAGLSKVFWGVTESRHLVDIINQTDAVESPDGEDKLGQPMVKFSLLKDWGRLHVFALPYFRERTFAGPRGRLTTSTPVDTELATYDSSAREHRLDTAIRYEHTLGNWDLGVAHFNGTSREAVLNSGTNAAGDTVFIPHYNVIDQTSLDIQYTYDAWLLKFEGITVSGQGERYNAMVTGLEYTFFDADGNNTDIGVLAEYQRDDRGASAPSTGADDDVFFGARVVMNDVPDTQFLGGVSFDRFTKNRSFFVEAERRLTDNIKLEVEGRIFSGQATANNRLFSSEDHVFIRLAYFF